MPRVSREISKTGIYHVMVRGNERREIFLCNDDRQRYLDTLREKCKEKEYIVLAYCLMDNHVHLLIKEEKDPINRAMKRIGVSYAYYFNKKYERTGHLFQDRFKSEPINDDRHLLAAVRYIHNNPVKAKMVKEEAQYPWSSYNEYIDRGQSGNALIIDKKFLLEMLSGDEEKAIKQFVKFSKEKQDDEFIDIKDEEMIEKTIKSTDGALKYIEKFLSEKGYKCNKKTWLGNKSIRNELIKDLKERTFLSTREIANILGINRNIVQGLSFKMSQRTVP